MFVKQHTLLLTIILLSVFTIHSVFAESWYVGKGLKQGDYFRYNVCFTDWNNCSPIELDFWVQNQTNEGNWITQFVALDGNIVQRGVVTISSTSANPLNYSSNLADYVNVYKNTLAWLNSFATKESPKDLSDYLSHLPERTSLSFPEPIGQENLTVQAGTFNVWIIAWHKGVDNKIWIAADLPFPVKALVYSDVKSGQPTPQYVFELLETGNRQTLPHFFPTTSLPKQSSGLSTPLAQIKNGILPEKVVCSDDLVLIKRSYANSIACVKPQTAQKLVERGWGTLKGQKIRASTETITFTQEPSSLIKVLSVTMSPAHPQIRQNVKLNSKFKTWEIFRYSQVVIIVVVLP